MNDKEAFENWYSKETSDVLWEDFNGDEIVIKTWQAACEYKDKSIRDGLKMKQMNDDIENLKAENLRLSTIVNNQKTVIEINQAENKKLCEALEFYANTFTWQGHYDVHDTPALILTDRDNESCVFGNRAREALKELDEE